MPLSSGVEALHSVSVISVSNILLLIYTQADPFHFIKLNGKTKVGNNRSYCYSALNNFKPQL